MEIPCNLAGGSLQLTSGIGRTIKYYVLIALHGAAPDSDFLFPCSFQCRKKLQREINHFYLQSRKHREGLIKPDYSPQGKLLVIPFYLRLDDYQHYQT
jgi:hypothetical protein